MSKEKLLKLGTYVCSSARLYRVRHKVSQFREYL